MFWSKKLKIGDTYACTAGIHVGKILIFIEDNKEEYGFLSVPEMKNMWIPKEKFDFGVEHDIIDYVERVPKFAWKTSKAQFLQNKEKEL